MGLGHVHKPDRKKKGFTNLFVLLSIMRPRDMPDFHIGTTRSWLRLSHETSGGCDSHETQL